MKTTRFLLAAIFGLALTFTFSSCGPSKAQQAAGGGFETVKMPTDELLQIKKEMEGLFIPCGIGIGESTDEMVARNIAADGARTDIAQTLNTFVERLSESYTQNVGNEAKKVWEESIRQSTHQELNGATPYKVIPQFNKENSHWKIYSLYTLNPEFLEKAIQAASAGQEELELRMKKEDMMKKLNEGTTAYNEKYKK
ncbi:MAG: hypothetical protein FWF63_05150 [Fibromonadales bacterium]|nr:hypothetical protein [Fibromonadales bacterium]